MRRAGIIAAIGLLCVVFAKIALDFSERRSLRPLAEGYVTLAPQERAIPNVITGILLTYRALDTLGEVAVLFMVAAGVGMVLAAGRKHENSATEQRHATPASEIVASGTNILLPIIAIFAAYIIMNGHLSAGGGFQGGAVIASAVMLLLLARPEHRLDLKFLSMTESLAGAIFVLIGIAGMVLAEGIFDNRVLPLGTFGAFFSAGAIPILSVLLGVKVGCELSVILDAFRK
jgi:multicomponent Na+:H+ antiporter subunit B